MSLPFPRPRRAIRTLGALASAAVLLAAPVAHAFTAYLKVEGVTGGAPSPPAPFDDAIAVAGYGGGVMVAVSGDGGAQMPDTPVHHPLRVVKLFDRATPELWLRLADGSVMPEVELVVIEPDPTRILLEGARLVGMSSSSDPGSSTPSQEVLLFDYQKITWTNGGQSFCWDTGAGGELGEPGPC